MGHYNLPIYTNPNAFSERVTNETLYVYHSMGALYGMPDIRYRVKISGMTEVDFHSEIESKTQFKVDYKHTGNVYFHPEFSKTSVLVSEYYSRGLQYFPASRIWTKTDGLGNVLETLEDIIEALLNADDISESLEATIKWAQEVVNEGVRLSLELDNTIKEAYISFAKLEELVSKSGTHVQSLTKLTKEGQRLEVELSDWYYVFKDVKKIQAELEDLYARSVKIEEELRQNYKYGENFIKKITPIIKQADETELKLNTTLQKAIDENIDLKQSIEAGGKLLSTLTQSQETGNILLESLKIINKESKELHEISKTLKETLDASIVDGEELLSRLTPTIEDGKLTEAKLNTTLTNAKAEHERLLTTIGIAKSTIKKMQEEQEISAKLLIEQQAINAESKKLQGILTDLNKQSTDLSKLAQELIDKLSQLLAEGGILLENLIQNISIAKITDSEIKESTQAGKDILAILNELLERLNAMLVELNKQKEEVKNLQEQTDQMIADSNNIINTLPPIITEGQELLSNLKSIIEGTDFEETLNRLKELEEKKADKTFVSEEVGRIDSLLETQSENIGQLQSTKADKTTVNAELDGIKDTKADKVVVEAEFDDIKRTKADKAELKHIYTEKEEPSSLKVGDQWHRIVD